MRHRPLHKPTGIRLVILVALAATGLGVGLGVALPGHQQSPHPSKVEGLLTAAVPAASSCGSWATEPTDSTDVAITQAAGPIARCELLGYTWVIITAGVATPPADVPADPPPQGATYSVTGAVLTYSCAVTDTTCLDPSSSHPFASWNLTRYPQAEYLKPVDLLTPTVFVAIGTAGQVMFNTATNTWFASPSSALSTCGQEWGSYEDSAVASNSATPKVSIEQAFITAHPECTSSDG